MPGTVDPEAARSAIAKIEDAVGAAPTDGAPAQLPATAESEAVTAVRSAVRKRQALRIEYYSASRDALSRRIVDPIRVVLVGDHSYLEGWCRDADGVRLFRFDRIVDAEVLSEPAAPPPPVVEAPPNTALFDADPSLPSATLRVGPRAAWMLEYFPMRVLRELPNGYCEAAMTFAAEEWMTRLILGFGPDVQVLAPASLVRSVQQAATAALAAYADLDG